MRGDALYDMDSRMSRNFQCNAEYSMIENIEWKEMLLHCTVCPTVLTKILKLNFFSKKWYQLNV